MQSWFRERPLPLPRVVADPPREVPEDHGVVVAPAGAEVALLVRNPDGEPLRLSWERVEGREPSADRRRALPAGVYSVVGLRWIDRSRGGEVWHTSATGRQLGDLDVEAGEEQVLELDPTIEISRGLGGGQVAMGITHPSGAGLSIYKDGRRIPIEFRLVAANGRIVASGSMRYG